MRATSDTVRASVEPGRGSLPGDPYEVVLGPWSQWVAAGILAGAAILLALGRPSGPGIDLCWIERLSGLPCPGCGLTRAVCAVLRMEWSAAFRLNPFSLLLVPWALVAVSSWFWLESWRVGLRRWLADRRRIVGGIYRGLVLAFVAFGLLRALAVAAGWMVWS